MFSNSPYKMVFNKELNKIVRADEMKEENDEMPYEV
jgi:hypothetical protein